MCEVVCEVCSVEGENEGSQDGSLWGPGAADHRVGLAVHTHILWLVCEVVQDRGNKVECPLQLVPQQCGLDGVESTEKS